MNKEDKRRFQAITGSVMCLGQVTRYDIGYAVNQLARAICKPSKAHGFKLTAFSDANWGNNPDNGKSTSSYIAFLSGGPVSFKVGLQGADGTIDHGGRARGRRFDNEGDSVLLQYDEGAGIRHALRQCTGVHRQHLDSSRRRQPDL